MDVMTSQRWYLMCKTSCGLQGLRQTDTLHSLTVCNDSFVATADSRSHRPVELLLVKVKLVPC